MIMDFLKTFVIALLCYCVTAARDPPKPCCVPDLFEISYGESVGLNAHGKGMGYASSFQAALDFTNKKYGFVYQVLTEMKAFSYQAILLVDQNVMYTIHEKKCKKSEIPPSSVPQQCVPDTATYMDSSVLGNNSLSTNNWLMMLNGDHGVYGTLYETIEVGSCIPVGVSSSGTMVTRKGKVDFMMSGGYSNYTAGVKDPDFWFTPPDSCPTQLSKDQDDGPLADFELVTKMLGGLLA